MQNENMPSASLSRSRRAAVYRRQLHSRLLIAALLLLILLFAFCNLVQRDRIYSETENRKLAQKPAFTWEALTDGSWFSDRATYFTDQFFGRDRWISIKLWADKRLGMKEANDVILGKDGYLFGKPEETELPAINDTVDAINNFAMNYRNISFRILAVPTAATIMTDRLPENIPLYDQLRDLETLDRSLVSNVQYLDAVTPLQNHSEEDIYYHTDHHWTSLGAYYVFQSCAGQMGIADPASGYDIYTVSDSFEGTLASKIGSHAYKDTVQVYIPQNVGISYYVTYMDTKEKSSSVYVSDCLEDKDKYTVFFGGNYPQIEIDTTCRNSRVLLLFKDSYANSFVQFLYPYFEKIVIIDPRYYYDDLSTILNSYAITDVLYLFSADTIMTDTSLADVLNVSEDTDSFGIAEAPVAQDTTGTETSADSTLPAETEAASDAAASSSTADSAASSYIP